MGVQDYKLGIIFEDSTGLLFNPVICLALHYQFTSEDIHNGRWRDKPKSETIIESYQCYPYRQEED
jgi:hypothetical protein